MPEKQPNAGHGTQVLEAMWLAPAKSAAAARAGMTCNNIVLLFCRCFIPGAYFQAFRVASKRCPRLALLVLFCLTTFVRSSSQPVRSNWLRPVLVSALG